MSPRLYRQGDVLLVQVDEVPVTATEKVAREEGRVVLAHGEVTGHAHAIVEEKVELVTDEQARELYLIVHGEEQVALAHEEHETIMLPPGQYQVRRQREYAPEENRMVAD